MTEKQPQQQAVIPTGKRASTYSNFVPSPALAMRDGMIVEPEDEQEPPYIDGMSELRREALKAAKARSTAD